MKQGKKLNFKLMYFTLLAFVEQNMTSQQRSDLRNYSLQSTARAQDRRWTRRRDRRARRLRGHLRGQAERRQEEEGKEEPAADVQGTPGARWS